MPRIVTAILALLAAVSASVAGPIEDGLRWKFYTKGDPNAYLGFGQDESDYTLFVASCVPGSGRTEVWIYFEPSDKEQKRFKFRLGNGLRAFEFDAEMEPDYYAATMVVPLTSGLFVLLGRDQRIEIEVGGQKWQLPLTGAAPQVGKFLEACRPKTSHAACGNSRCRAAG